jgi:hypothetical protein
LTGAQVAGALQQGVTAVDVGGAAHRAAPVSRNGASQAGSGWSAS